MSTSCIPSAEEMRWKTDDMRRKTGWQKKDAAEDVEEAWKMAHARLDDESRNRNDADTQEFVSRALDLSQFTDEELLEGKAKRNLPGGGRKRQAFHMLWSQVICLFPKGYSLSVDPTSGSSFFSEFDPEQLMVCVSWE